MAATNVKIEKDSRGQVIRSYGFGVPTFTGVNVVAGEDSWQPEPYWKFYDFEFDGDGTLAATAFIPANSKILRAKIQVLVAIAGNSAAKFDVGSGSDEDALTPTQVATVTAGVKQRTNAPLSSFTDTYTAATDLTISVFAADGTTAANPTSGKVRVSLEFQQVA